MLCAGCDRLTESTLAGTWRGEDDSAVDEIAFHPDHTLVWWSCGKKELSTPNTVVSAGGWHIQGNQVEIELKQLTWPTPSQNRTLLIVKMSNDSLLLKDAKASGVMKFLRLDIVACATPRPGATLYPIEPNITGTWQVHYNTHDYKYRFASDHLVAVSARDAGAFEPMWKGVWDVAGSDLVMDLKADWKYATDEKVTWTIYGFEPRCFTIKDPYSVSYAVHRVE